MTYRKNKKIKILLDFLKVPCYNKEAVSSWGIKLYNTQIWFIGRTLASQAEETGSTPAICLEKDSQ